MKIIGFKAEKHLANESKENNIVKKVYKVFYPKLDMDLILSIFDDKYDDDWESCSFSWGMWGDYEGELYRIVVDDFVQMLKKEVDDEDNDWEQEYVNRHNDLIKSLENYKGFILYPVEKWDLNDANSGVEE